MSGSPHISPSLRLHASPDQEARELKFVISASTAAKLTALASQYMSYDPHCLSNEAKQSEIDNSYKVQSVYLDTPTFSVLNRLSEFRYNKFRIRRYGKSDTVFMERKSKRHSVLSKQRAPISLELLSSLDAEVTPSMAENWFAAEVSRHELRPACSVSYHRRAFFMDSDTEPIRLTLDYQLSSRPCDSPRFAEQTWEDTLRFDVEHDSLGFIMDDQVVMEMKFIGSVPSMFKCWIAEQHIAPCRFSKYRTAMHCLVAMSGTVAC